MTSPHVHRKNEQFAELLRLKDTGELKGSDVPWMPEDDRTVLTAQCSTRELAVRLKRSVDAVRDRQDALYLVDTVEKLRALPVVPLLDAAGGVVASDYDGVALPAAVIAGARGTAPADLIAVARDRLAAYQNGN